MRARLGRIAAWIGTAAALGWVFWKTPIRAVQAALAHANPWLIAAAMVGLLLVYAADSLAMWRAFWWFLARLSFREVLIVRGASYLLAAINYSVGQAAIVYFVHRTRGVPVMRGVATVLLIMGTNLLLLLMMVTGGLALGATRITALPTIVGAAWIGLLFYIAVIAIRPRFLTARPLFDVLLSAGVTGHLKAVAVRVPHVAALIIFQVTMFRAFHVAVPIIEAVTLLPVVFFIAALPLSVQGLGTTQAAMILFFAHFAPGAPPDQKAAVVAASLVGQALALALQATIGFVCLQTPVGRTLRNPRPAQASP